MMRRTMRKGTAVSLGADGRAHVSRIVLLLVVLSLGLSGLSHAQRRTPTRIPPRPLVGDLVPVQWGAALTGVEIPVTLPVSRAARHPVPFQLPLYLVRFVDDVTFPHQPPRVRVHFTDYTTLLLERCPGPYDTTSQRCSLTSFFDAGIAWLAIKSPGPVWDSLIKVATTASGCAGSLIVVGRHVAGYDTGSVPGFPALARIHYADNGPKIRTCYSAARLEAAAHGVYWPFYGVPDTP